MLDKQGSKSVETVFLIAICHRTCDKRQSKALSINFISTILDSFDVYDCHLPGVIFISNTTVPLHNGQAVKKLLEFAMYFVLRVLKFDL